jgi:transcriptional regulator GlxA family with amidase domain
MQIVFFFYEGMTALDAIGPHEILCRIPGASVIRAAQCAGPIHTDSQLILTADYPLTKVKNADILVIPGAGNATSLKGNPEVLKWIQEMHATTTWTTSICTGSLILGAAGILSGLRATTHWAAFDRLSAWNAYPTKSRVVEDGKVITAAGVSAGIDMALILASKIAGDKFAQAVQLGIEYDPNPPFDVGSVEKADCAIREALRSRMMSQFEPVH